jgi:hypothetical protein
MYRNAYQIPDPRKFRETLLKGRYNIRARCHDGIIPCKFLIKAFFSQPHQVLTSLPMKNGLSLHSLLMQYSTIRKLNNHFAIFKMDKNIKI